MNRSMAMPLALAAAVGVALATPVAAGAEQAENPLDQALQRYWGERREEPVVHFRLHPRAGRTEVAAHYAIIPNDAFRAYSGPGISVTHFLAESFSLGATALFARQEFSDLGAFLDETFQKNESLYEQEQYELLASLEAGWVPFYGKLAFLGFKLCHFDLGAYLGAGAAQTTFLESDIDQESNGMTFALDLGVGVRLYVTRWVTVHLDWREHFVKARHPDGGFIIPSVVSFGLGTMFPYPEDRK